MKNRGIERERERERERKEYACRSIAAFSIGLRVRGGGGRREDGRVPVRKRPES